MVQDNMGTAAVHVFAFFSSSGSSMTTGRGGGGGGSGGTYAGTSRPQNLQTTARSRSSRHRMDISSVADYRLIKAAVGFRFGISESLDSAVGLRFIRCNVLQLRHLQKQAFYDPADGTQKETEAKASLDVLPRCLAIQAPMAPEMRSPIRIPKKMRVESLSSMKPP